MHTCIYTYNIDLIMYSILMSTSVCSCWKTQLKA